MLPKNCGKLLYNAVRETLETMAFASVTPCSIKVAGEEFAQDDDFAVTFDTAEGAVGGWGDEADQQTPASDWGTAVPDVMPTESWGDNPEPTQNASVQNYSDEPMMNDWGETNGALVNEGDLEWGQVSGLIDSTPKEPSDPWGDSDLVDASISEKNRPQEADFDAMASLQTEWCWASMKVNSPDVHSVLFIISRSLAHALMENMYAGEETDLDTPLVRDLIAELTNVLGGRLMLLLEEMGGKFTLTVPDIGFGLPDISDDHVSEGVICKVVVDNEHPIIVTLRFNPGGVLAAD